MAEKPILEYKEDGRIILEGVKITKKSNPKLYKYFSKKRKEQGEEKGKQEEINKSRRGAGLVGLAACVAVTGILGLDLIRSYFSPRQAEEYARKQLERKLTNEDLYRFRQEAGYVDGVESLVGSEIKAVEEVVEAEPVVRIEPEKVKPNLDKIDYDAIIQIESAGNPRAYNKNSGARGLMQITPIVLKEWNNLHPNEKCSLNDLYNPEINKKIGIWYLENRIKRIYLPNVGLTGSIENILAAYNWGIGNLEKNGDAVENFNTLPTETREYIGKYNKINSN